MKWTCFESPPPCVYLLLRQQEIIYVGQSENLIVRVVSHLGKKFDRVLYYEVEDKHDRDGMESWMILNHRPYYNSQLNHSRHRLSLERKATAWEQTKGETMLELITNFHEPVAVTG